MLLGEALIEAEVITEGQLQKALLAQKRFPGHALGPIVAKLFDVPSEVVETVFIKKVVVPIIDRWFRRELASKPGPGGINLGDMISDITIDLMAYSRYEGELVSFRRNEQGYYLEQRREAKLEKVTVEKVAVTVRTIRRQEVSFANVALELALDSKYVRPVNPGFVVEARLKLLQALKQK